MTKFLVLYSYFETENSKDNLTFFIKNGVFNNDEVSYIFLINNHKCSVSIPEYFKNVKVIKRDNIGIDFASWSEGLIESNESKSVSSQSKSFATESYDYFIFLNDTVIGPFLPRYNKIEWYKLFCNLLDNKYKLSGITINYIPFSNSKYSKHVQSMAFCTDKVGLNLLIENKILLDNQYDTIFKKSKIDYIIKYEIGMSKVIINNGYKITALALSENKNVELGEIWCDLNSYISDNINPLETIFYKNNRIKSPIYNLYTKLFF